MPDPSSIPLLATMTLGTLLTFGVVEIFNVRKAQRLATRSALARRGARHPRRA